MPPLPSVCFLPYGVPRSLVAHDAELRALVVRALEVANWRDDDHRVVFGTAAESLHGHPRARLVVETLNRCTWGHA